MDIERKSAERLAGLGIVTPENLQDHIKGIFKEHSHQHEVIESIYGLVVPDWDKLRKLKGHPAAGKALCEFIFREFIRFDKKHHPGCLAGGAWMNWGFSSDENLDDWEISLKGCNPEY